MSTFKKTKGNDHIEIKKKENIKTKYISLPLLKPYLILHKFFSAYPFIKKNNSIISKSLEYLRYYSYLNIDTYFRL